MNSERLADLVGALDGRVSFAIDDRRFTMPQRPIQEWLRALADPAPDAVVPALLDHEDSVALYDLLTDPVDPLDPEVCEEAGRWVMESVAGRPWWEVVRLVRTGLETWNALDGWCMERGLTPETMNLRRFCNAVVKFAMAAIRDQSDRESWYEALQLPPGGNALADRPEWSDDAVGDSFDAVFANFGG